MSEMIERVAAAVSMLCPDGCEESGYVAACVGPCKCRDIARAAIEAMREPTPTMIVANSDAGGPDDEQTRTDWRDMIDAALE